MAAMRPEYNEKVSLMVALAPVVYMGNMASPLFKLMAKYIRILEVNFTFLTNSISICHHYNILALNGKRFSFI